MIGRIIGGLVGLAVGFVLVWKSEWFQVNIGSIQWAEEHFGTSGGSRLMYKLIGILIIIISFLVITNLQQQAFVSIFGWLFGVKAPDQTQ